MTDIIPYPDPTPEMLDDPMFNAIWDAIKGWDIRRNDDGFYTGATGNDARHILDAIRAAPTADQLPDLAARLRSGQASPADLCDAADAVDERKALKERVAELEDLVTEVPTFVRRAEAAEAERDALKAEALEALKAQESAQRIASDGYAEALKIGHLAERRILANAFYTIGQILAPFIAKHSANITALRHKCASSGFHEHDGCACTDDELMARYSAPADTRTTMDLMEQKGKTDD